MKSQKLLDKIYNDVLEKPNSYHYVCYGGSSIKMVDKHTFEDIFICNYQGDDNWMTPICKSCKGLKSESKSLTENQRTLNYGIKKLYDTLSHTLVNET